MLPTAYCVLSTGTEVLVTDQDGVSPAELPSDALPEPRCEATTQSGSRCRNRPIEGQRYCRVHAALAGQSSALPDGAVALPGSTATDPPIEIAEDRRADT